MNRDFMSISIVKPESKFDKQFARVIPVETAEGLAIVKIHSTVSHVQCIQRRRHALAEIFAYREIEGGVLRQMALRIRLTDESVTEARAVINVGGKVGAPRQRNVGRRC